MGREIFLWVGRRGGGCVRERQGDGEAGSGFRSELRRRPDADPSAYALLRALSALHNPPFPRPSA